MQTQQKLEDGFERFDGFEAGELERSCLELLV
jgi:hypothetical protein